jgi:hypothetical protein
METALLYIPLLPDWAVNYYVTIVYSYTVTQAIFFLRETQAICSCQCMHSLLFLWIILSFCDDYFASKSEGSLVMCTVLSQLQI